MFTSPAASVVLFCQPTATAAGFLILWVRTEMTGIIPVTNPLERHRLVHEVLHEHDLGAGLHLHQELCRDEVDALVAVADVRRKVDRFLGVAGLMRGRASSHGGLADHAGEALGGLLVVERQDEFRRRRRHDRLDVGLAVLHLDLAEVLRDEEVEHRFGAAKIGAFGDGVAPS